MNKYLSIILLAPTAIYAGNTVKVAIIDSGINPETSVSRCSEFDYDVISNKPVVNSDSYDHGSHIGSIIDDNVRNLVGKTDGYCQFHIKIFDKASLDNTNYSAMAIELAITNGANVINYSGGGSGFNQREYNAAVKALNKNIIFVAAAGNEGAKLDDTPYYQASYDKRIVVVGNLQVGPNNRTMRHPMSNYGSLVDLWVMGTNIVAKIGRNDVAMTGTSQSAAIVSGRFIAEMLKK